MKKTFIIICICFISAVSIAQENTINIGDLEITFRNKSRNNSCSESCQTQPSYRYKTTSGFWGIGFILPNSSNNYYATLAGNSFNLDFGVMQRHQFTRRFALGGTCQYSFYNYRLRDAAMMDLEPEFVDLVIGREFDKHAIQKQAYRSHNLGVGAFARFYLIPPTGRRNDGLYIDLGAQGDFSYSKFYKIKTNKEGNHKFRNDYAFNPFTASAIARVGWKGNPNLHLFNKNSARVIFVRYRFTDAFNSFALPKELPPISIGMQFMMN